VLNKCAVTSQPSLHFLYNQNIKLYPDFQTTPKRNGSWGSSFIIVSDYRLDDRGSIRGRHKGFFSSYCVQTRSGAHPVSCPMGTGGTFSGGKARPERDSDHSHLVLRSRMSMSYISSPFCPLHDVVGQLYLNAEEKDQLRSFVFL
jgi:hypothetical protein